jgi:hypothetical protein
MNRPDLIVVGMGNGAMRVNLLEAIRKVPAFKRAPDYLLFIPEIVRYSDVSVITITIDDPDYTSEDLYVLFVTTPTERQYSVVNETVIEIEKLITRWFHGVLYLVDHASHSTLCTIRKNMKGENDETLEDPLESIHPIADIFSTRDKERAISSSQEEIRPHVS